MKQIHVPLQVACELGAFCGDNSVLLMSAVWNSLVFSLLLNVLISSAFLQLSESEFQIVGTLTQQAFVGNDGDVCGGVTNFWEEQNAYDRTYLFTRDAW